MNDDLETMRAFFDRRTDSYESHMKNNVKESAEFYREMAKLVPIKNWNQDPSSWLRDGPRT